MAAGIERRPGIELQPLTQQISVPFHYSVHFTAGLLRLNNPLLAQTIAADGEPGPKSILIVIDAGLLAAHPNLLAQLLNYADSHRQVLRLAGEPVIVPGGEAAKNDLTLLTDLHSAIHQAGLCRHSYLLAIGGGAVLDSVGYAAATAHRGIRLIRVPTTVLAQNDSGVGVKNGINAFGQKNFLGTFAPPYAVLNDVEFLETLAERDWRAGVAEAVKVALIHDRAFFAWIEQQAATIADRNLQAMQQLIYRCAQLHLHHIATGGDPFESGSSRPLDFGHWAAHKLEQLSDHRLRHGEAVAIGIALDSTYSHLSGWLPTLEWQRILQAFTALGFTLYVPELAEHLQQPDYPRSLFRGLTEFREHLGGTLTLTLLAGIGQGFEVHQVDLEIYRQAVGYLRAASANPTAARRRSLRAALDPVASEVRARTSWDC